MTWLLVVLAGAAGTAARHGIGQLVGPRDFPWATLAVNVVGSFLIGVVMTLGLADRLPAAVVTPLAVGFLGGFTTFSALTWDAVALARTDQLPRAVLLVAGSTVAGLLAALGGYALTRWALPG